jgi:hypothetical protein
MEAGFSAIADTPGSPTLASVTHQNSPSTTGWRARAGTLTAAKLLTVRPLRPRAPRPRLTPEQKRAAREQLRACRDAQPRFALVAALGGGGALYGGGVVIGAYAVSAAVLTALLNLQTRSAERAVEDPPRPDYMTRTRARRTSVNLEPMRYEDPDAAEAAESLRVQTAYLSALVRALERAQGAAHASDEGDLRERLREARGFAEHLTAIAQPVGSDLRQFALSLETRPEPVPRLEEPPTPKRLPQVSDEEPSRGGERSSPRLLDVLPKEAKWELREMRVPLYALDVEVPPPSGEPAAAAAESLRQVASAIEEFGIAMTRPFLA